jgi:hypothetical protein
LLFHTLNVTQIAETFSAIVIVVAAGIEIIVDVNVVDLEGVGEVDV